MRNSMEQLAIEQQDFIDELIKDRDHLREMLGRWQKVAKDAQAIAETAIKQRDQLQAMLEKTIQERMH